MDRVVMFRRAHAITRDQRSQDRPVENATIETRRFVPQSKLTIGIEDRLNAAAENPY